MKKTRKRVKLCGVDRLMIMVIALLIVFTPVLVVYSKTTLSESNIELERIKRKVETNLLVFLIFKTLQKNMD